MRKFKCIWCQRDIPAKPGTLYDKCSHVCAYSPVAVRVPGQSLKASISPSQDMTTSEQREANLCQWLESLDI